MAVEIKTSVVEREKNQPINQWVYQLLWANIIELHLKPGQFISEIEVSDALGVSRTPAREAFIRLANDRLLEILPQKGSKVAVIDLTLAKAARFVRNVVEKAIMSEACSEFAEQSLVDMRSSLTRQAECLERRNYDGFLIADNDFHRILYCGCGREEIWLYLKRLDFDYDRLRTMTLPRVAEQVLHEHQRIAEIISHKEPEMVDSVVDEHLTWDVIEQVVSSYPADYFK